MTEPVQTRKRLSIVPYDVPGLGDRSYLVHDGEKAAVVDPQRDPAAYVATADELGVDITLVLETHVHNDYVSGGLALARRTKATYGVPAGEPVDFGAECEALQEGDALTAGELAFKVLDTPGHTPHHLSYLVEDGLGSKAVMTGGSLLAGSTGRTDLLGAERTAKLAEAQWHSVRRLLNELSPNTVVLPTHGFGSFCSAGTGAMASSDVLTIADERPRNPASQLPLEAFVETLLLEALPVPAYYRHMAPLNRAGASEPRPGPPPTLAPEELPELVRAGTVVIDLRERRTFAGAHRRGALNIELSPDLTTYLGWLVPFAAPFILVSDTPDEAAEACHWLSRIGRETAVGWAPAGSVSVAAPDDQGTARYEVRDFPELARRAHEGPLPSVLDVRFPYEWDSGHIRGARPVPLPDVAMAYSTMPDDEEIWVHCQSGYRAAIAASVLSGVGLFPVLVDDTFENALGSGLMIVHG